MSPALRIPVLAATVIAAGAMVVVPTAAAVPADPVAAVTAAMSERGPVNPRVTVTRRDGNWAFGTAVALGEPGTDRMPDGWLFLAERTRGGWEVAFDGQPAFAELAAEAPLVNAEEKPLFAQQDGVQPAAGSDFRTGMSLPWATGQTWGMPGGPHGWSGTPAPWSSLDLAGGDQRVRAARAGTAYTMCRGWIRVIHDRGYATDYYHLWNNINVNGAAVAQGAYLGDTGTDVTCGGSALGRHVHFALRQNNAYVDIAGHNLGKWVPQNGGSAYSGSALHGSARVNAGGSLYNYGALGFNQGVVDTNGGGSVNKRSGPGTGYGVVGSVADGATVTVSCSSNGTTHSGRYGATSLWNRLSDGTWMSDAFLWSGVNGPIAGYC